MSMEFLKGLDADKLSEPGGIAALASGESEEPSQPETQEQTDEEHGHETDLHEAEGSEEEIIESSETDEVEPEADEEPEEGLTDSERKSVKYFKEQLAAKDRQYNELVEALQEAAKSSMQPTAQPEADEFEPLDPEADARTNKKLEEMQKKQDYLAYQSAVSYETAALSAEDKVEVGNAYNHLLASNANKMLLTGSAKNEKDAYEKAAGLLDQMGQNLYSQGRPIASTVYQLAQAEGYKPGAKPAEKAVAPKKQPKLNPDAIEKNRLRTEKKPVKSGQLNDLSSGNPNDIIKQMTKPGSGVDPKKFNELLKRAQKG